MKKASIYRRMTIRLGVVIATLLAMTIGYVGTASASTTTVSGTVTDPSSAVLNGATVSFDDQTTPGTPTTATTNGSGQYSVGVTTGHSYNITISPPSGSSLVNTTYLQYEVNGSTLSLSVQLRNASHTVTGTVQDKNGQLLPSETVKIRDGKGTLAQATTDANGAYSLTAPSYNDYSIETTGSKTNSNAIVPGYFVMNTALDLTSDTTKTINVEAVTVTVTVRDTNGAVPVGTSTVALSTNVTTAMISHPYSAYIGTGGTTGSNNTDSNAQRTMVLLANSKYIVTATGSYIDGYGQTTTSYQYLTTSDASITVNIPVDRHTISGTITGLLSSNSVSYKGKDLEVKMMNLNGSYRMFTTTTDNNGNYSITVPSNAGSGTSYRLYVNSFNAGNTTMNPLSGNFSAYTNVTMNADRTGDVVFPYDLTIFEAYDSLGQGIHMPLKFSFTAASQISMSAPFTGAGTMTVSSYGNTVTDSGSSVNYYIPIIHGSNYTAVVGGMPNTVFGTATYNNIVPGSTNGFFTIPNNLGAPTYLSAASPTSSAPALSWNYSGSGVYAAASYNIYRDEQLIGTSTTKNFTDTTLTTGGTYVYKVAAVNSQDTVGARSSTVSVTYNP